MVEEAQLPGVSGSMWDAQLLLVGTEFTSVGISQDRGGSLGPCSSGDKERLRKQALTSPEPRGDLALNGGEGEEA